MRPIAVRIKQNRHFGVIGDMAKILITGAGGLIGTRLQQILLERGHEIHTIGRSLHSSIGPGIRAYTWDLSAQQMDPAALEGVDGIIHLAGAGVADERWTRARKKEIMDSRVDSTRLLLQTLAKYPHEVRTIVSASAVGYYGDAGDEVMTEKHPAADTFLAEVTASWEREVRRFESEGVRHVCCRIGIVLAPHGGALPELTKTLAVGVASYFDKTPLYYPWIHLDDVCGIMIHALEHTQLRGSYNTTAPDPVPIKDLMKAIVRAKKSKAILMPVPAFGIRLLLGEMAEMVLSSQRCSASKIMQAGYSFHYPDLDGALRDIYPGK